MLTEQGGAVMELRTERLYIHPVRPRDREAIARLWSSPRVTRYLSGPRARKAVRRGLREQVDPDAALDLWAVEERDTGRIIGHAGLVPKDLLGEQHVEIIYVFGSRHWGKGYATETVHALLSHATELGLSEVIAMIHPENEGSRHVAEKLGFQHVRTVLRPAGPVQVWSVAIANPSPRG